MYRSIIKTFACLKTTKVFETFYNLLSSLAFVLFLGISVVKKIKSCTVIDVSNQLKLFDTYIYIYYIYAYMYKRVQYNSLVIITKSW